MEEKYSTDKNNPLVTEEHKMQKGITWDGLTEIKTKTS